MDEGGILKQGVSFSLCGGELEGGLVYWGPWRICAVRLWKRMSFSIEAPFWGTWRGCSFPRDFKRRMRVFHQENFYWGIQQTFKRRLWKWSTPAMGAPLGNLRGFRLKGILWETDEGKWSISLYGSSARETLGGGPPLLGTLKDM